MKKILSRSGYLVIALYLIIGLIIVWDYGIYFDEPIERVTSLVNYKYVMSEVIDAQESGSIKEFFNDIPDLAEYDDRYYGAALHFPLLLMEHLKGFTMASYYVYPIRHVFNFLNYVLGALCFYEILRRRFKNLKGVPMALMGLMMYILFPRFFGEAFYNNKDILFLSWYVITAFCAIIYLENPNWGRRFLFAAAAAVCTNTRILGVSIVLLAAAYHLTWHKKKSWEEIGKSLLSLLLTYGMVYVLITPYTWDNPIKAIINTFFFFFQVVGWNGKHLYLGEMITRHVPWHYLPVWMGATIPVLYQILFIAGCAAVVRRVIIKIRKRRGALTETAEAIEAIEAIKPIEAIEPLKSIEALKPAEYLYDSFFTLLFFCSLFGFVGLRLSMYNGWRHAYFIFCPFLYLAVRGLAACYQAAARRPAVQGAPLALIAFGAVYVGYMVILGGWIIRNHPYQYAYFNRLAVPIVEENFEPDYWGVSSMDVIKKLMRTDTDEQVTVYFKPLAFGFLMLNQEESARFKRILDEQLAPEYIIMGSRGDIRDRREIKGYQKIDQILVDGIEINSLYQYLIRDEDFKPEAGNEIANITVPQSADMEAFSAGMEWTDGNRFKKDEDGNEILVEFAEPVDYNLFRLAPDADGAYSTAMEIAVSADGIQWSTAAAAYENGVDHVILPCEYRYIRFTSHETKDNQPWSVAELTFGRKNPEEMGR